MLQTAAEPAIADDPRSSSRAEPTGLPAELTGDSPLRPPLPRDPEQAARSLQLAVAAAETARENRATDIAVLDMRGVASAFDYFVVATGTSRRQLHAISEDIDHRLEDDLQDKRMGIEGYAESRWILLDYGSVVIHLFDEETRSFYALEDLWVDAQRVELPWDPEE